MSKTEANRPLTGDPCWGCGEIDPAKACLGCSHFFTRTIPIATPTHLPAIGVAVCSGCEGRPALDEYQPNVCVECSERGSDWMHDSDMEDH